MLSIIQKNLVSYQESTFLLRHFGFDLSLVICLQTIGLML